MKDNLIFVVKTGKSNKKEEETILKWFLWQENALYLHALLMKRFFVFSYIKNKCL